MLLACVSFATVNSLVVPQHKKATRLRNEETFLKNERAVLAFLKEQPEKGRVYLEWFSGRKEFSLHSERFIESNLFNKTGFETANGLFVQSAAGYRYTVLSAIGLGARTTAGFLTKHIPYKDPQMIDFSLLDKRSLSLSSDKHVARLLSLGVSHVVAATELFVSRLQEAGAIRLTQIGPFTVFKLGEFHAVVEPDREVIGYLDLNAELPFSYLSLFIYSHHKIPNEFELIELEQGKPIPAQVKKVIVNGRLQHLDPAQRKLLEKRKLLVLDYRFEVELQYLRGLMPSQPTELKYNRARSYLRRMKRKERSFFDDGKPAAVSSSPQLIWDRGGQGFRLSGLSRGKLIRINYNYFPMWQSADGVFYRGTAEKMYFLPERETAQARYKPLSLTASRIGWGLTLLCTLGLLLLGRLEGYTEV